MSSLTNKYTQNSRRFGRRYKKALWISLLQAFIVVVLILLSARFVTVLVLSLKEEPVFSAPKTIYLPQRELEHQMAVSEFQNAAATPSTIPALSTESLLANAPPLPDVPGVEFTPVENEPMATEADSLFGQSGLMGALGALSSQASSVSFLGITEEAARFVIIMDISSTVKRSVETAGSSMEAIRDEAMRLIESLNSNTLFGFIQHARNYDPFQEHLIPATIDNKEKAQEYLKAKFRTNGTSAAGWNKGPSVAGHDNGLLTILNFAFQMQPDVIFLISDGGYLSDGAKGKGRAIPLNEAHRFIRLLQKDLPEDARIHSIHFPDPSGSERYIGSGMRSIASRNGGEYRKIEN